MKLTEKQRQIRDHREGSLLVSAAAGSGKTMTLVEHILARLTNEECPGEITRLLVVTYTVAAASELRSRLKKNLSEKLAELAEAEVPTPEEEAAREKMAAHLRRQSALIPQAHIGTMHSFYSYLTRSYFQLLEGASPDVRIADENELKILQQDVLKELLEDEYLESRPDLTALLDAYTGEKDDRDLQELILQLYESAGNAPDPDAWLDSCAGSVPQDPDAFYAQDWLAPFDESLRRDLAEAEAWALRLSARCEEEDLSWAARYRDLAREDAAVIRFVLDQPDLRRRKAALQSASFARWPAARKGDDKDFAAWFRRERGSTQGYLKLFQEAGAVWTQESEADEIRHVKMTEEPVRTLVRLTRAYAERLRAALREKNLTSFAQMEHDTLSLLRLPGGPGAARTPLAEELSQQFDEIIVDEYQDINAVQESILSALSGEESGRPNLFMVGDIKQSIYRFRRARAEIFLEKYRRFTYGPGPHRKIDLDTNFRSRRSVLDFANAVFSRIMTADLGGIVYDEAAALKYGASYEGPDPAAEWLVAEGGQDAEYEAAALRVQELLQSGETVYDLKTGRHEPIRPGHIVILSPVLSGVAGKLVKALQARGIAASAAEKNGFFNSQEIRTMTAVLQCVDDPLQDIPLAAVLLSPLGGFSDEDLARIHAAARGESFLWQRLRRAFDEEPGRFGRAGAFLEKLARWRALSDRLPVAELLSAILEESGYDLYLRAMPEGSVRLENIRRLILLAEQYEKTSYSGLYRFISYIERQKELEMDRSPGGVGESTDAVRIMTVHAAKGLEFPVVLLVGTSRGFSFADASGSLLIHEDLGAVPGTADTEKRVIGPNLRRTLASRQIREEILAEKLRVLYVALTRAGSRLIVCSAAKEPEKFEADADAPAPGPLPAWRLRSAGSFLSWLGLLREAGVMPKPRIIRPEDLAAAEEDSRREEEKLQLQAARLREEALQGFTGAAEEELRRRMQWTYPHEASLEIRGVYSVSEIKSLQAEAKTRSRVPRYFLTQPLTEAEEVPDAETLTAASRGTAYHKVLQYLPIGPETKEEAGIRRFLEQMQAEGRLSAPEAAAVDPAHLAAFRKSALGQRIRRAAERGRVFREQPFLLGVPSPEIFPGTEASETILIQGIIDLFFEEEDGLVLVDYKTDRVQNTAELWERYAVQMQLYRRALEQATGKPVRESIIWSLVLDRGSGPS